MQTFPTPAEVAIIIILFIIGLTLVDITSFFKKGGINHRSFKNDVVTIGILGTFLGIYLGLYKFDVDNITASIPLLLEGMTTAFITSIVGMGCSVVLTIIQKFSLSPYSKSGNPVTDKLSDQARLLAEFLSESKKTNEAIIAQVKNHRIESKDELTKVRDSLDKTLEKLSEGATKEIIKALEQVISDFNQNLTEQFGENFKQLNQACLKLVQWQTSYIVFIERTEKILVGTTQSLRNTSQSMSEIANRNKEFEAFCNNTSVSLNTMNRLLENNTAIQGEIKNSILALKSAAGGLDTVPQTFAAVTNAMQAHNTKAIDSLEQTNTKLDSMMQAQNTRAIDSLDRTNTKLDSMIKNSSESVNKLNDDMAKATENLNKSLVSLTKQFGENYRAFLEQIKRLMP